MATKKPTEREALKHKILLRARKVVRECDQALRDFEHWNAIHPARRALDVTEFRQMRDAAQGVIDQFARQK